MNQEYSIHIAWSREDGAYLATIPELAGCVADGQTREEALENVKQMALEWMGVAKEEKRKIPPPVFLIWPGMKKPSSCGFTTNEQADKSSNQVSEALEMLFRLKIRNAMSSHREEKK